MGYHGEADRVDSARSAEHLLISMTSKVHLSIYSKGRVRARQTTSRCTVSLLVHFPGLGQAGAMSQELDLGHPSGWQGPKCLGGAFLLHYKAH